MAQQVANVLQGITEVGHVTDPYGTPADVSWGATEQDGVEIRVSGETLDVQSAQSTVLEDMFVHTVDIEVEYKVQYGDLLNLARALGLDTSSYPTGDLQGSPTPSAEVLEPLMDDIGRFEFYLYAITPGPKSTRRFEFKRCKVAPSFNLALASTAHQAIAISFKVLRPKQAGHENTPVKVTDAL